MKTWIVTSRWIKNDKRFERKDIVINQGEDPIETLKNDVCQMMLGAEYLGGAIQEAQLTQYFNISMNEY